MNDPADMAEAIRVASARFEKAEAEVRALRAKVERVEALADRWPNVVAIRAALDGDGS